MITNLTFSSLGAVAACFMIGDYNPILFLICFGICFAGCKFFDFIVK